MNDGYNFDTVPTLNILATLDTITTVFAQFEPQLIYLFGSQVTGRTHRESDIDLAILGAKPSNAYQLFIAAQKLVNLWGREVDVVDLATASIVMRAEVVSKGELLYCTNIDIQHEFEMYTFSMYAQANLDRREVLRNYGVNLDV